MRKTPIKIIIPVVLAFAMLSFAACNKTDTNPRKASPRQKKHHRRQLQRKTLKNRLKTGRYNEYFQGMISVSGSTSVEKVGGRAR